MRKLILTTAPALAVVALAAASPASAQSAALSGALEESAEAVGAGSEAGLKVASAATALPMSAVGVASAGVGSIAETVADGSYHVAEESLEAGAAAIDYANEPLTIGDEVIVATAPAPNVPYRPEDADPVDDPDRSDR